MPSDLRHPGRAGKGPRRAAAAIVLALAGPLCADVVERRGSAPDLDGVLQGVDDNGVTLRSELGAVHVIPWDRVRDVRGAAADPLLAQLLAAATDLWRARSRVERGDTRLAEPLLERLFEEYRGRTNETALVVSEGLLRCRVARGDQVLAVLPALEVARLRRAGVTTESYAMLPTVFDDEHALCGVLAPVWLPSSLLESLAHELETYDAQGDEVIESLRESYHRAVLRSLGAEPGEASAAPPQHPGVELMQRLDAAMSGDRDRRNAAREQLRRAVPRFPSWAEAWARYQVGASLLLEPGVVARQEGAVSLAHLPARFSRTQPFLTGLAMARLAAVVDELGDDETAERLRLELQRSLPHHPLHALGELWPPASSRASSDGEGPAP